MFLNYGRSQANDYNFNIYSSGSLSINHIWYRSVKSAWSAGLDAIYFGAAPYAYPDIKEYIDHTDRMFYGVFGGRHWIMGKTSLFVQVGVYLYSHIKPPQPVYPRLGIRHRITDRLVANFSVKASFLGLNLWSLDWDIVFHIKRMSYERYLDTIDIGNSFFRGATIPMPCLRMGKLSEKRWFLILLIE